MSSLLQKAHPDDVAGALEISRRLRDAGYRVFWAGGWVRDVLLGRAAKDVDVVTSARPGDIHKLFPAARAVGRVFGVMLVPAAGRWIETATFRRDGAYRDGRHPVKVEFAGAAEEDARRRDFTINGLFYDPFEDRVLDYVQGLADLDRRVIRAIGDPDARFREDHLRLIRAVRFAAVLDFELEDQTRAAILRDAPLIRHVSAERIREELTRLLTEAPRAGQALVRLSETGLLKEVLPEVEALRGVEQPADYHPEGDVFVHTVRALDAMDGPGRPPELTWAVLLHDVGKPSCARQEPDAAGRLRWRFHGHGARGAEIADDILGRLRCSRRFAKEVVEAIRNHDRLFDVEKMRPSTLRRMVGAPGFALERELHRIDALGARGDLSHLNFVDAWMAAQKDRPVVPPPLVRGGDLAALGLAAGPEIGLWLKRVHDAQLDHPEWSRDDLLAWIRAERDRSPSTS